MTSSPPPSRRLAQADQDIKAATGVIIPVYLPATVREEGEGLVWSTVAGVVRRVDDPTNVCVVVDGAENGAELGRALADKLGVRLLLREANGGKLRAIVSGATALLDSERLQYIAIVDQDGDHFANELPNMLAGTRHATSATGNERVMAIGHRHSRCHPMGWERGELEELADRVLLDALQYRAAIAGEPLDLSFTTVFGEFPDFHSGYKVFTRPLAAAMLTTMPPLMGLDEAGVAHHGVEAVLTVEAILAGGLMACIHRSTINQQPMTTFGLYSRVELVANKMIWPCKRLGVPPKFVDQWLRHHSLRLAMQTLAPAGQDELQAIREAVLAAWDHPPAPITAPAFL